MVHLGLDRTHTTHVPRGFCPRFLGRAGVFHVLELSTLPRYTHCHRNVHIYHFIRPSFSRHMGPWGTLYIYKDER